jgi:2-C-methyl-D-erythritol 4-phosphate cytidylyltransferase
MGIDKTRGISVAVVIVCAGRGRRLKGKDKPVVGLGGKPLFFYAVAAFSRLPEVKEIALVMRRQHFCLAKRLISDRRLLLVEGGRRRQDSVRNGLFALSGRSDYVLIHDGARPFVSEALIRRVITALRRHPAVVCALPVSDTLKLIAKGEFVKKTVSRDNMYTVQTPQGFRTRVILSAYKRLRRTITDDVQALEGTKVMVKVVEGEKENFKVTYEKDLIAAREIAL